MKKAVQYPILLAIILGIVIVILVTIILRGNIYELYDSFIKSLGSVK